MRTMSELWTEDQRSEVEEWLATEPGMRQRLAWNMVRLEEMKRIGAPPIMMEAQEHLIAELEAKLDGREDNGHRPE